MSDSQAEFGAEPPKDWLKQAVSRGVQALVVLHLDGGPSSETATHTGAIWYRIIKGWPIVWNEELDRSRLTAAFLALAGQAARWPSPNQLRQLLPARHYPKALPQPVYPAEKAAANLAKIKAMIKETLRKPL